MSHDRLLLVLFSLFCLSISGFGAVVLPGDEVDALKNIGEKLGKMDWNLSADPCIGLYGWITGEDNNVTCDCSSSNYTSCHIVSIVLTRQSLAGILPSELTRLPYLQQIDLSRNYLSGTIPSEWGSMANLVNISLLGNRLTGPIPRELGNISTLESLVVEANQLSGNLHTELGRLSRLQRLQLSSNNFTGELPSTFANLTALKDIRLSDNQFSGKIPNFIQSWKDLEKLVSQASGLQGPIPAGISSLVKLSDLRISDLNGTEATFPQISNTNIKTLILRSCNLIGELPAYLGDMTNLKTLDVSFNKISGEIPSTFQNLAATDFVYLTGNQLTGLVPDWLIKEGQNVDLSYNNFTVGSPVCQERTVNLFASSPKANNLGLVSCLRSFHCPRRWHNLYINCGGREVSIGSTAYNEDIDQGAPARFFWNSAYNWAYSSTGHFMNDRPTDSFIWSNTLTTPMDDDPRLYMTARLSPISLTYYGFCLENGNYTVTLHFAEIMFSRNNSYTSLGRRIFDIYIQGRLVFKDFNIEDAAGGVGKAVTRNFNTTIANTTLEIRLYWAGKGTTAIPSKGVYGPLISAISINPNFVPRIELEEDRSKISTGAMAAIVAAVAVAMFLLTGILWLKGCFGQKLNVERDLRGLDLQTGSFTLRQIKAATSNFDAANKIGEGGFGPVYKGLLSDGTVIAVKQLSSRSKQGNREFVNEIGMISGLQHPHLVKLYGCCVEGNQLLLVYEYLENNSLARALFGPEEFQLSLDWPMRHMICVGIAKGLAYLHEESRLKIVHRDIKATNVLLDKNLNPKISDFGLAKLDEEDNSHISTRIAGTYGYMAPEYAMHGYLTDKADVYSFGIVALETVSGRSNTSCRRIGEFLNLLDWAHILKARGGLMELVDPRLGSQFNVEEVMVMIEVALLCTDVTPTTRPAMSSVVSMLEGKTVVPLLIPRDGSTLGDEMNIEAMRRQLSCGYKEEEWINQSHTASFSASADKDLYPLILDSSDYKVSRLTDEERS
ncbi:probable leucine-rich repeat receptor-like serine/threonine-protein kinase At3g14840 [Punica granatum]|uniref:non-specific serine/threonine protein kinase n=1 Tax=Punica granatum TaxID=22663 RepID=A0A6P8D3F0_PUNGR|nr:probable leucine-rich repeat receptor-like serine/threonine-protein kinase At3g14840 [Punica granatum]